MLFASQVEVPQDVLPLNKEAPVAQTTALFRTPLRTGHTLEPSAPGAPTKVSRFAYYSGVRIRDATLLFPEDE